MVGIVAFEGHVCVLFPQNFVTGRNFFEKSSVAIVTETKFAFGAVPGGYTAPNYRRGGDSERVGTVCLVSGEELFQGDDFGFDFGGELFVFGFGDSNLSGKLFDAWLKTGLLSLAFHRMNM